MFLCNTACPQQVFAAADVLPKSPAKDLFRTTHPSLYVE